MDANENKHNLREGYEIMGGWTKTRGVTSSFVFGGF